MRGFFLGCGKVPSKVINTPSNRCFSFFVCFDISMADLAGIKPVYYGFTGAIDDAGATRIATALNAAVNQNCDVVHLAFNSLGGLVAAGIYLYHHIRALPIQVITYNLGSVASIAVAVFVGADERYCSKHSLFMIHPTAFPNLQGMTWERLNSSAESALAEDERTECILRERTRLPDQFLQARRTRDVHISPQQAVDYSLVNGISEFQVPSGHQILQI